MAEPAGSGRRKAAARVEVHHFPKRAARTRTRTNTEWTRSLTAPEMPADELVTEAHGIPAFTDEPGEPETSRSKSEKGTGKRTMSQEHRLNRQQVRRRTPTASEAVTLPGVAVVDVLALTRAKDAVAVMRRFSREQLSEVTLGGHRLFEEGKLPQARVIFEGLVGLEPADSFPYTMLGTIYLGMKQHDRALALFEAALGMDRTDLAARVYRAEIRLQRGKPKQAITDLEVVVEFGVPSDPFVQRARRLLRLALQPVKKARK